jgi:CheY-like chemotaxis protein
MRILYVEDNRNDARLVTRYLETTPYELVVVSNVDDAWAALSEDFDIILIDVLLGQERAGYGFAQALRQQQFNRPLVAVTALTTQQDIAACYHFGFDYVLAKPYTITELADVIQQCIS